jgi:uncharacterized membrane protein
MKTPFILVILLLGVAAPTHVFGGGAKPDGKVGYDIKAIPLAHGTRIFEPRKLNAQGEVLGLTYPGPKGGDDGPSHVVVYRNGKTEDLHMLLPLEVQNAGYSFPLDLNNHGDVLFSVKGGSSHDHCFLFRDGRLIDLNAAVGPIFEFAALNDAGELVGTTLENNIYTQAFSYSNGQIKILGFLPGYPNAGALMINNTGKILGWAGSDDLNLFFPVSFETGGLVRLDLPEVPNQVNDAGDILTEKYLRLANGELVSLYFGLGIWPLGMNNHGVVAGIRYVQGGNQAVLYDHGVTDNLNETVERLNGWNLVEAVDINDDGQIVGMGLHGGQMKAFFMSPRK